MIKIIFLISTASLFSKSITIYNNNLAYINSSKEYEIYF